jgi:hypothetical protein
VLNSKGQRAIDGRLFVLCSVYGFNSVKIKQQTDMIIFPFVNRIVRGGLGGGMVMLQDKMAWTRAVSMAGVKMYRRHHLRLEFVKCESKARATVHSSQ